MSVLQDISLARASAPPSRPGSPKLGSQLSAAFALCFHSSPADEIEVTEVIDSQPTLPHLPRSPSPPSRNPTPITAIRLPSDGVYGHSFLAGLNLDGYDLAKTAAKVEATPAMRPNPLPITPSPSEGEGTPTPQHQHIDLARFSNSSTLSPPDYPQTPEVFNNDATSETLLQRRLGGRYYLDDSGVPPKIVGLPIYGGIYGNELFGAIEVPNSGLVEPLINARFSPGTPLFREQNEVYPIYLASKGDKKLVLEARLFHQYTLDATSAAVSAAAPIHIFVDLSNITIGFYECLKLNRNINQRLNKAPPFSFENFSHILERGRPVAFKTVAGSALDGGDRKKWPLFMKEAAAAGYEMNILSRVTRTQPPSSKKRRGRNGRNSNSANRGINYVSSDANSSADDTSYLTGYARQGEQAVDEILHLKMCNSVLDHEPGTIVLATGDAAEAEFSDGFLRHAERALDRGWCVELLTWSRNISFAWKTLEESQKYGARFRIIDLDDFAEELLAIHLF